MHSYAQLLSKLLPSPQNGLGLGLVLAMLPGHNYISHLIADILSNAQT